MDVALGSATVSLPALDATGVDVGALSTVERVDALTELQRARAWVDAAETRLLAAMVEPGEPSRRFRTPAAVADKQWVREEIACALRVAPVTVNDRLHVARTAVEDLPSLLAAVESGRATMRHVRLAVEALDPLDHDVRVQLDSELVEAACVESPSRFRKSVAKAVLAVDPRGAAERHDDARAERKVEWFGESDGMGVMKATLPAEDLAAVREVIQAAADHRPAHREACAWVEADRARRAATSAGANHDVREPSGGHGLAARDVLDPECPGCAHLLLNADQRRADALLGLLLGLEVPAVRSRHGRAPAVQVSVALSTLLGIDDQPGDLLGHGPVPAEVARRIAADPSGTWRRLVTDELGHLIDYGRSTYKPPQELTDHVLARDRYCRFPNCGRQARTSELDHLQPWAEGGVTAEHNMIAGCSRHHHLRHEATGWTVTGDPAATLIWITPTGHAYADAVGSLPVDTTTQHADRDDQDRPDAAGVGGTVVGGTEVDETGAGGCAGQVAPTGLDPPPF